MKLFKRIKAIFTFLSSNNKLKRIAKNLEYVNSIEGQKEIKKLIKIYLDSILTISPYEFEVHGYEKLKNLKKTFIFSNHKSNYDPLAIQANLPFIPGWFAKKSLCDSRFFGHIGTTTKAFPIDRGNRIQTSIQFLKAAKDFKNGRNIAIFPEGTRSKTEDISEFKTPIFAYAKKLKADILPIKLDYRKSLKNEDGTKNKKFIIKILNVYKFEDIKNLTPEELKKKIFNSIKNA